MSKKLLTFSALLLVLGGALLAYAASLYSGIQQFRKHYEKTQGVVSKVSTTDSVNFYPHLKFKTLDNQRLNLKLRRPEASLAEGDTVEVYYDLVNPADLHLAIHQSPHLAQRWGLLGILLFLPGLMLLGWLGWHHRRVARLRQRGQVVNADFLRAEPQLAWAWTGLRPHRIVCAWTDPAQPARPRVFESGWVLGDPTAQALATELKVLLDPAQPDRYHVDLSFLPAARYLF
ncbi:MAG: DUF3592 domain-containing protein [Bernardetiaceae bacterium]|jgi:hypothetical protein|nr:DUF3592 domain-containing protein [Bernardetiaceae bacterium]